MRDIFIKRLNKLLEVEMESKMPKDFINETNLKTESNCFSTTEEAWFWFMKSIEAGAEGADRRKGESALPRPCEVNDIFLVISRLHRQRMLLIDHIKVLSHYGKRGYAPDKARPYEQRAYYLWCEAIKKISNILIKKKIVKPQLTLVSFS